jgi:hypothetical protein
MLAQLICGIFNKGKKTKYLNLRGRVKFPTGGKAREHPNRCMIRWNSGADGKVRMKEGPAALQHHAMIYLQS